MADEDIVTTEGEQDKEAEEVITDVEPDKEPTPEAEPEKEEKADDDKPQQEDDVDPSERYEEPKEENKKPEAVPLHVHKKVRDELKAENRQLRQLLASQNPSQTKIDDIASRWGVPAEDVKALAEAIKSDSTKEIDQKYSELLEQQKREKVDKAFNDEFEKKIASQYPQLAGKKEQIKALAFTKPFLNKPLDEIAQEVYGDLLPKGKVEQARPASDKQGEVIDFQKLTDEQLNEVMKNPEAKKKYFDYLDKVGTGRSWSD